MRVTAVQKPRQGKWKDAKKMAIRKGQAMATTNVEPQTALKFETEVLRDGKLELQVPLAEGRHVTVFVVPEQPDAFSDLTHAAQSSLDFWDNPLDDEDWNNA